ncbi:MAG: hypothetical protein M1823_005319 [Watsoniomyces obsoletus]|nr:MAG: hypothetical protein M1823_005319 [Watsoniomyces obsoletus]
MSSTASPEVDSSPSRNSLASKLTKARRKKQQREPPESSQNSLALHDESNSNLRRMKNSIELAVEKIKPRSSGENPRESDNEGKPKAETHGLQNLLRRTKRKSRRRSQTGQGEAERGRTFDSKSVDQEGRPDSPHTSRSASTKDWGRSQSSLLTYDSESPDHRTPPPLVSHPSHAGYLTLSSPLVRPAQAGNEAATQEQDSVSRQGEPQLAFDGSSQSRGHDQHKPEIPELVVTSSEPVSSQPAVSNRPNSRGQRPASGGRPKESSRISAGLADQHPLRDPPLPLESVDTSSPQAISARSPPVPPKQTIPNPGTQATRPRVITAVRDGDLPTTPPANVVNPITTVTPPTPIDRHHEIAAQPSSNNKTEAQTRPRKASTEKINPGAGQMLAHRRVQSTSAANPPSRLSRRISPPLTPTVEETRSALNTPGIASGPSGQSGFFSSVFSAAQNAASTLSSSIANTSLATGNRSRGTTQEENLQRARGEDPSSSGARTERGKQGAADHEEFKEPRSLAVETLGLGDLSLSHLGITVDASDEGSTSATSNGHASSKGADTGRRTGPGGSQPAKTMLNDVGQLADASQQGPRARTGTGVSEPATVGTNGEATFSENGSVPVVEDAVSSMRPRSMQSVIDKSGAASAAEEPDTDLKRSGSLRSRVDHSFRRRRDGSAATGTTTGTVIGTNTTTPTTPGIVPRLTGFAVASKKRNRDFHNLFRSVPEDDFLIEDYSAAIQKDILLHGRLYVSEGHICFNSNIFGYVTTLVISFDEVVSVEKKNTAMVFPNAIVISTLHARNVFASLASRESTYDLIVGIWKISHPNLRSSLNGVQLDEAGGGDKTVKAEVSGSDGQGDEDEDDEEAIYDEDADGGDDDGSLTEGGDGSKIGSDIGDGVARTGLRQISAGTSATVALGGHSGDVKADKVVHGASTAVPDFPGPATHKPTECGDQDQHFERITRDEVVAAPLGKIYSLLFGPNSGLFMTNWLRDEQKVSDLQMEDDKTGLTETTRTRSYSYIKPITAPIGPKSTKCFITETLDALDLEKAVSVTVVTQTPDVPSGNVFSVRTRYCLTWAEDNGTRVFVNCTIEWTGKSWLKGPIEKGANDGQIAYTKELVTGLRAAVSSKAAPSTIGIKGRVKRRKRDVAEAVAQSSGKPAPGARAPDLGQTRATPHWGPLEPLRQPLSPFLDILSPLLNAQVGMVVMSVLLLISWFRTPQYPPSSYYSRGSAGVGRGGGSYMSPERLAAYEEMWRREEGSLWDWLDERVGVDRISSSAAMRGGGGGDGNGESQRDSHQAPRQGRSSSKNDEKLSDQQMTEALRLTQQRLDELRSALERRQAEQS